MEARWEVQWEEVPAFMSWDAATKALLLATCEALNKTRLKYVIVGGWVPKLRGGNGSLAHPGTRDVDVLFDGDFAALADASRTLLSLGFISSAKHPFQLLMPLEVLGRRFVFNIDLMHPLEAQQQPGLMTEVLDLGIPDEMDPSGKSWIKSIVFKSAPTVFSETLWTPFTVSGTHPRGEASSLAIPLLDEAAFILSKCESVSQAKRPRDAFDIYYVLTGPAGPTIKAELERLARDRPAVAAQLSTLRSWIDKERDTFRRNVERWAFIDLPTAADDALALL